MTEGVRERLQTVGGEAVLVVEHVVMCGAGRRARRCLPASLQRRDRKTHNVSQERASQTIELVLIHCGFGGRNRIQSGA